MLQRRSQPGVSKARSAERIGDPLMSNMTFQLLAKIADELSVNTNLLESFFFGCRIKNLTASTLKCYAERLEYLVRYAASIQKQLDELTQKDIQAYVMSIIDAVSPATVNGRIRVFKVFYAHLKREAFIEANPMDHISLVRTENKIKPVLSVQDMTRVLAQFNRRFFNGARDYCMLLLCYDSMIRLNELLSIRIQDVDLYSKLVKVFGKGRKERYVPFSDKTSKALHTFLIRHRKGIPGDLVFCTKQGKKLDQRRAHRIFQLAGKKVGIYVHPHLVRHSSASQFVRMGGSASVLQKILGHSSLAITQRYVHLSSEDLSTAYERFSPAAQLGV
jgi:integrase/recombinase XerD